MGSPEELLGNTCEKAIKGPIVRDIIKNAS
jgi:hypothetical protein